LRRLIQPVGLAQRPAPKASNLDFSGVIETVWAQDRISVVKISQSYLVKPVNG